MGDRLRRVGVVFGGRTPEHEVSVVSARGVWSGFDRTEIAPIAIAVDESGRFRSDAVSRRVLEDGRARVRIAPGEDDGVRIVVEPGVGLVRLDPDGTARAVPLDAVLPVMHGWGGEDGRLQGLLDLAGVPCVGSGVAGSAAAMDKAFARALAAAAGLPLAPWSVFRAIDWRDDPGSVRAGVSASPGFPAFVKPANGGSSVGITRVTDPSRFDQAVETALRFDRRVVVERAIDAREIEVAVLGDERPEASVPGEIVPAAEFYTYDDKYRDGAARLLIPAPLDATERELVCARAVAAYRALDLAGMARVDFLMDRTTGEFLFNEANTLPGFTPISMYSKLWEASGVAYPRLLTRLVDLAIARGGPAGDASDR